MKNTFSMGAAKVVFLITLFIFILSCDGRRRRPMIFKKGHSELSGKPKNSNVSQCEQNSKCTRNMKERGFSPKRNCFCDSACKIYNDCCRNYRHMGYPDKDDGVLTSGFKVPKQVLSCERVDFLSNFNVYVISRCPSSFKDAVVRKKCESLEWDNDIFTKIPVTDRFTRLLFRNVYCAKCFGGDVDYSFWSYAITCSRFCEQNPEEVKRNASLFLQSALGVMEEDNFALGIKKIRNFEISLQHPEFTYRNCKPHISKCSPLWSTEHDPDGHIQKKCRGHTNYVYVGMIPKTVYRNTYCALCNFVNESEISCLAPDPTIVGGEEGNEFGSSMAILLDINSGSASAIVGRQGEYNKTRTVVTRIHCENNEVFDPLAKICRRLGCSDGFVLENGKCISEAIEKASTVEHSDNFENILSGNEVRSECARITLNSSDFVMFPNGSILVPTYKEVFSQDEYIMDNGYASICTPFTEQNYTLVENQTYIVKMFKFDSTQSFISFIGTVVSLFSLLFHFVVYMCLPPLRNIPGKCLICLVVSLFVGQLLFLVGTPRTEIPEVCVSLAVIMHFAFLAAFFWMNVMAFDIWRTFTPDSFQSPSDERAIRFTWYSVYAWFIPLLVVGIGLLLHFSDPMLPLDGKYRPNYGDGLCWITRRMPLLYLFAIPVGILILCNIILYILTIKNLCILSENAKMVDSNNKWRFVLYIKLSFIMGLTWVFGFLAAITDMTVLWYVFIIFNSLQGAFICVAFVCTKKVYRLISEKVKPKRRKGSRAISDSRFITAARSTSNTRSTTLLYEPQAKVVSQETSI